MSKSVRGGLGIMENCTNFARYMKRVLSRSIITASLAVLFLAGCNDAVDTGRATVPYVEDILSEETEGLSLLSSFDPRESRGTIALVGPEDTSLVNRFLKVDDVDNIDGRPNPDLLPDFAGEQIDIINDKANAPYVALLKNDSVKFRTVAVRNLMAAIDTAYSIGAFDDEKLQTKLPAKVVVYTSPLNAEIGAFDVDTLCRASGCSIPVVFPSRLVFGQQLDRGIEHLHIAVVTDSLTAASGVYSRVFDDVSKSKGILGTGCIAVKVDSLDNINTVLSDYKAAGGNMPLSALVIDSREVDIDALRVSLDFVMTHQSETNLNSRKLITKDFVIVDMNKAVTDECYRILRSNNIFTHNISYPVSRNYVTVKSTNSDGYNLVEKD